MREDSGQTQPQGRGPGGLLSLWRRQDFDCQGLVQTPRTMELGLSSLVGERLGDPPTPTALQVEPALEMQPGGSQPEQWGWARIPQWMCCKPGWGKLVLGPHTGPSALLPL